MGEQETDVLSARVVIVTGDGTVESSDDKIQRTQWSPQLSIVTHALVGTGGGEKATARYALRDSYVELYPVLPASDVAKLKTDVKEKAWWTETASYGSRYHALDIGSAYPPAIYRVNAKQIPLVDFVCNVTTGEAAAFKRIRDSLRAIVDVDAHPDLADATYNYRLLRGAARYLDAMHSGKCWFARLQDTARRTEIGDAAVHAVLERVSSGEIHHEWLTSALLFVLFARTFKNGGFLTNPAEIRVPASPLVEYAFKHMPEDPLHANTIQFLFDADRMVVGGQAETHYVALSSSILKGILGLHKAGEQRRQPTDSPTTPLSIPNGVSADAKLTAVPKSFTEGLEDAYKTLGSYAEYTAKKAEYDSLYGPYATATTALAAAATNLAALAKEVKTYNDTIPRYDEIRAMSSIFSTGAPPPNDTFETVSYLNLLCAVANRRATVKGAQTWKASTVDDIDDVAIRVVHTIALSMERGGSLDEYDDEDESEDDDEVTKASKYVMSTLRLNVYGSSGSCNETLGRTNAEQSTRFFGALFEDEIGVAATAAATAKEFAAWRKQLNVGDIDPSIESRFHYTSSRATQHILALRGRWWEQSSWAGRGSFKRRDACVNSWGGDAHYYVSALEMWDDGGDALHLSPSELLDHCIDDRAEWSTYARNALRFVRADDHRYPERCSPEVEAALILACIEEDNADDVLVRSSLMLRALDTKQTYWVRGALFPLFQALAEENNLHRVFLGDLALDEDCRVQSITVCFGGGRQFVCENFSDYDDDLFSVVETPRMTASSSVEKRYAFEVLSAQRAHPAASRARLRPETLVYGVGDDVLDEAAETFLATHVVQPPPCDESSRRGEEDVLLLAYPTPLEHNCVRWLQQRRRPTDVPPPPPMMTREQALAAGILQFKADLLLCRQRVREGIAAASTNDPFLAWIELSYPHMSTEKRELLGLRPTSTTGVASYAEAAVGTCADVIHFILNNDDDDGDDAEAAEQDLRFTVRAVAEALPVIECASRRFKRKLNADHHQGVGGKRMRSDDEEAETSEC